MNGLHILEDINTKEIETLYDVFLLYAPGIYWIFKFLKFSCPKLHCFYIAHVFYMPD